MRHRRWLATRGVLLLLVPFLLAVGCAKRPVSLTSAVPAPGGAAGSAAPARTLAEGPGVTKASAAPAPAASTGMPASPGDFRSSAALKDIHFDFDHYDIRLADARILDDNAAWLKANPRALILIEGHADERGTNEYNLALGDRRARSTMSYLLAQGVAAARMSVISYGKERPACAEHGEACWAQNRRAHFLVKAQ